MSQLKILLFPKSTVHHNGLNEWRLATFHQNEVVDSLAFSPNDLDAVL